MPAAKSKPAKPAAKKPAKAFSPARDVRQEITDKIVAQLEQGVRPWSKPWKDSGATFSLPVNFNGVGYRGANVLVLWMQCSAMGYSSNRWMTYKQAESVGAQVRKGERGTLVAFYKPTVYEKVNAAGEKETVKGMTMKSYTVFNVDQIDNLPEKFQVAAAPAATLNPDVRDEAIDAFFTSTGADIRHGGNRAFYVPSQDYVQMPKFEAFSDAQSYYSTLGHECVHWTGHKSRLNRSFSVGRFGDETYAMEELVAEIGAAFLGADLGLFVEPRECHAAYIQSWLKALKNDKTLIFKAASAAQKAVDLLLTNSKGAEAVSDGEEVAEDEPVLAMAA